METELEITKAEYEQENNKWTQLKVERDQIQNEIDLIDGRIREIQNPIKDPLKEAAEMLLRGEYKGPNDVNPMFTKRDDLAQRRRVLLEAIRLQEEIVRSANVRYSVAFGRSKKDEYTDIVKRTVDAVIELSRLILEEQSFRDQFRVRGLSFLGLGQPCNFTKVGHLKERYSRASMFISEAIRIGHISAAEIEKKGVRWPPPASKDY